MKPLTPYLFFDGNCREAMDFYKSCFGGELFVTTFGEAPKGEECPGGHADPDKVMHACLTLGDFCLMASDNPMECPTMGDHISINITCSSMDEIQSLFAKLSEGGKVCMPLGDTFWGAHFGMLSDRFGFNWMLNYPLPGQEGCK